MADNNPLIVRTMDNGKFVRVNDSFKAKVGFDAAELAEKPFLDWIDPCDRTIVQAALENDERTFIARHTTRDGSTLQLEIQVAEHEEGLFVLGQCVKGSTQLESNEARSAEATVFGTLDAIARIIEEQNTGFKCSILLVAEGRFVFGAGPSLPEEYNSAVNGYAIGPNVGSCGTAIFWNTPVIVEDIQADPLWAPLAELAKKAGIAACWSHPFTSSSGNVLGALALYSTEPCAPTTEQLSQLKAAARITGLAVERGRAEEELKRSDESIKVVRSQMQATLNALPDLLFEVDSECRIFRYHSPRTELLAVPPEEFIGKLFTDVLPPDAAAPCQRAIDEAVQKGFSYGETYRLALPHGEYWFELSVAPLHDDAKSNQRFVVISRDITERKIAEEQRIKLEQQFQQTQKLESLGVLAGGIAHDFNNILAIIMGYCSLTKMNYEAAEKHVPEIEKAAERAAALCSQMLAYAGKASLTQSLINTRTLVDEMLAMLKTTIQKNVVIKPELGTDIPFIMGDASQIRQVVMNLIINAAEAIGDAEGEIHVSLAKTEFKAEHPEKDHLGFIIPVGRHICFEVSDNGCGMDDDTRRKIFEPFYSTKFTGRGLGMSAVLGIIKSHNGALKLESRLGHGTNFRVYLPVPLSESEKEEAQQTTASAAWQGSGTILLAEDEVQVKTIAIELLQNLGFKVLDAANGKEALELYQHNAADITLVVTDMGMPVMNGYDLFYKLKQLNPQLPIIISSGFGEADVASKIPREAMAGFISKPYRFDQLREVLSGVVEWVTPDNA